RALPAAPGGPPGARPTEPPSHRAPAEAPVRAGNLPAALIIPKGFGQTPISFGGSGARPRLELLADSADPVAAPVVSGLLQGIAASAMPDVMAPTGVPGLEEGGGGRAPQQRPGEGGGIPCPPGA